MLEILTGFALDQRALIEMIEDQGGLVVADDLCTTSRYFWHLADEGGDPKALAALLDRRCLCACMHPMEARLEHILSLATRFQAQGVVDFTLKYCHPFLYEAPLLKRTLEARGLPLTVLEVGHDMSGHGQLRTRIQAFLEMVEG